jgi:hypothetical protein
MDVPWPIVGQPLIFFRMVEVASSNPVTSTDKPAGQAVKMGWRAVTSRRVELVSLSLSDPGLDIGHGVLLRPVSAE